MYDLSSFSIGDMTTCGRQLRDLGLQATSMEQTAKEVIGFFHDQFRHNEGTERSFALVRLFKSHPYGQLDPELQVFAKSMFGGAHTLNANTNCLVLLATAGDHPDWNERKRSQGHQAIPLASEDLVAKLPMISELVSQFGLEPSIVIDPKNCNLQDLEERSFNVFLVQDAQNNPNIPAQADFVEPYRIRSVLGFGGMLPSGGLFCTIMFSRVTISRETAGLFKPLALCVKTALLDQDGANLFD